MLRTAILPVALVPVLACANEFDDAVSRTLVIPRLIYEHNEKKHRDCVVEHFKEERLASLSQMLVSNRQLVAETRERIAQFQASRARGEKVDELAEANTLRWLPQYEKSLGETWIGYKNVGGPADRIETAVAIQGPCGPVPKRPKY